MINRISVIISSYSTVISSGFMTLLSSLNILSLQIRISRPSELTDYAGSIAGPAIYFIDTTSFDTGTVDFLRRKSPDNISVVGIFHSALPDSIANAFDETISIYSDNTSVKRTVNDIISRLNPVDKDNDQLTPREKEIVVGVVNGLSNKEIASSLNVSVNTVMTHRRNIASKLQIHSAAGLTIYAIVSKLVRIDDIKSEIL